MISKTPKTSMQNIKAIPIKIELFEKKSNRQSKSKADPIKNKD